MRIVKSLAEKALDAFWQVVVDQFPHATSGDLSPETAIKLDIAAERAVREWFWLNATTRESEIAIGYRFTPFRPVDRFPDFRVPSDLTGVVTAFDEGGVWARMDQHIAGAEHWDNQIYWETPEGFAEDTLPI